MNYAAPIDAFRARQTGVFPILLMPYLNNSALRSGLGLGEAFRVVDQHRTGEIRYTPDKTVN